jgi:hypothetical protein
MGQVIRKKRRSCGWAFARVASEHEDVARAVSRKALQKWWKLNKHTTYNPEKFGFTQSRHPKIYGSFLYGNYVKPAFALGAK